MATIRDVARESGVSVGTVSNVLNNRNEPVRAETRQKVLSAARLLNYQPNAMARGLVRRKSGALGILFHTTAAAVALDPYTSALLQGILRAAAEARQALVLYPEPWRSVAASASLVGDRRVDGMLVIAPAADDATLAALTGLGFPLVFVSATVPTGTGAAAVDVDNEQGARLAAEHLLALGHRRMAHLRGDHHQASALQRESAFREALAGSGVALREEDVLSCTYQGTEGYDATRALLARPEGAAPTAIFAANDRLAVAALQAARDAGVEVPGRLSIVGFDDAPAASLTTPALTTIRQPLPQIGETAVRLLSQAIQGDGPAPANHLLAPELVVRGSTAPPPPLTA